jgi:hypothetical protein
MTGDYRRIIVDYLFATICRRVETMGDLFDIMGESRRLMGKL